MVEADRGAFGPFRWFSVGLGLVLIAFWIGVIVVEGFGWASAGGIAGMSILIASHWWDWRRRARR